MCEVEVVVKDIDGASFHRGVMIDVETKRGALVQLVANTEQRWLPRNAMRLKRDSTPPQGFQPRVGELVEVQVIETDDDEPFYRLAEIRREHDGIYFVRYGGPRGTRHDRCEVLDALLLPYFSARFSLTFRPPQRRPPAHPPFVRVAACCRRLREARGQHLTPARSFGARFCSPFAHQLAHFFRLTLSFQIKMPKLPKGAAGFDIDFEGELTECHLLLTFC
jgi:hypothetical protein